MRFYSHYSNHTATSSHFSVKYFFALFCLMWKLLDDENFTGCVVQHFNTRNESCHHAQLDRYLTFWNYETGDGWPCGATIIDEIYSTIGSKGDSAQDAGWRTFLLFLLLRQLSQANIIHPVWRSSGPSNQWIGGDRWISDWRIHQRNNMNNSSEQE